MGTKREYIYFLSLVHSFDFESKCQLLASSSNLTMLMQNSKHWSSNYKCGITWHALRGVQNTLPSNFQMHVVPYYSQQPYTTFCLLNKDLT
jgi:hypothetical protein